MPLASPLGYPAWLLYKDSNPDSLVNSQPSYHWTIEYCGAVKSQTLWNTLGRLTALVAVDGIRTHDLYLMRIASYQTALLRVVSGCPMKLITFIPNLVLMVGFEPTTRKASTYCFYRTELHQRIWREFRNLIFWLPLALAMGIEPTTYAVTGRQLCHLSSQGC